MNFLEGGVVANAKEKNIIDDEIFVKKHTQGKKCILVICRKNLILLVILSGIWFQEKQVDI